MSVLGGGAYPVKVVEIAQTEGGIAIPVYGYDSAPSGKPAISGPVMYIGCNHTSQAAVKDLFWNGNISALAIYSRPLSAAQVATIAAAMAVLN